MSATRSMGTLLGMLKKKITNLEEYIEELKACQDITDDIITTLKKLRDDVESRFIKTEDRWDALVEQDEFKDTDYLWSLVRMRCSSDIRFDRRLDFGRMVRLTHG